MSEVKKSKKGRGSKTKNVTKTGIAYGDNAGHIVTPRAKLMKPSRSKGKLGVRIAKVRAVINEVAGHAPYEKRIIEILRGGGSNPGKRAHRFAKNRLGTHTRAKRKVDLIAKVIAEMKRREQAEKAKTVAEAKARAEAAKAAAN